MATRYSGDIVSAQDVLQRVLNLSVHAAQMKVSRWRKKSSEFNAVLQKVRFNRFSGAASLGFNGRTSVDLFIYHVLKLMRSSGDPITDRDLAYAIREQVNHCGLIPLSAVTRDLPLAPPAQPKKRVIKPTLVTESSVPANPIFRGAPLQKWHSSMTQVYRQEVPNKAKSFVKWLEEEKRPLCEKTSRLRIRNHKPSQVYPKRFVVPDSVVETMADDEVAVHDE